jgi:Tol biopolymer transport system component
MRAHSSLLERSTSAVCVALCSAALLTSAEPAFAQPVTLISSSSDGTIGNSTSSSPSISADGQFVAFASFASNLVPGDTNASLDMFVKDRSNGAITRVSVTSAGDQAVHDVLGGRISADGRFVVFHTNAALVPEDTSGGAGCTADPSPCVDVYVHDRQTSTTSRVSVSTAGAQANDSSYALDISGDGRFVLFHSKATNLIDSDWNTADVFMRDRLTNTTTRVSVDRIGRGFQSDITAANISADGSTIIFGPGGITSVGGNHTPLGVLHTYDRAAGTAKVISDAFPQDFPAGYNRVAYTPAAISANGSVVIAHQLMTRLPAEPASPALERHVIHDLATGRSVVTPWRPIIAPGLSTIITGLSGDGRIYVTKEPTGFGMNDRVNGFVETVFKSAGATSNVLSLSTDGRFTTFESQAAGNTPQQVYVNDRDAGDGDGIPGAWETTFGLNPASATDAAADADLDGVTNLQEYLRGSHPKAIASLTRYFAEGASNAFFTTRFAAVNPGNEAAGVVFRFLGSNGETTSVARGIPARSRITLELPAFGPAPANDYSTVIEADHAVVVDRTMTWDQGGYGAHSETSLASPATTWFLAEGATHGAFDLFYLLQNANDTAAQVTVNYLRQAPLTPITRNYTVEANSRRTIYVDQEGPDLSAVDTAASFTSTLPIVVERAMYSTRNGQPSFAAGHGAAAVTAPALRWFLAEGATGSFFDLYVLVGNPNATASTLKVTYLLPAGAPIEKFYTVGPQQRLTIYVQDEDPRLASTAVSTIVESTNNQPIVVERAMWWPKPDWYESHVSAGATSTGTRWAVADGEVTAGGDTYILIANTATTAGTATITLFEEGAAASAPITVALPASSRVNVPVSTYLPPTAGEPRRRFGALIESSGVEIVVERSTYTSAGGLTWSAGTAALATKLP